MVTDTTEVFRVVADQRPQHDAGAVCRCVTNHNPNPMELHIHHILPLSWGGTNVKENRVWLCPTSHVNVHELLRAYQQYEGLPPWEIRQHFSPYIRLLAGQGWIQYIQAS